MRLGIVAGSGALPGLLAAHCEQQQIPFHLFAIDGQGFVPNSGMPCSQFRLGAIGTLVRLIRQEQITDLVFIGGIKKPSLFALRPDLFLLRQLPTLGLFRHGDDTLLRRIADRFERILGVTVRGIHELMPELLAPAGVIGTVQPSAEMTAAIATGAEGARAHGLADRGQAVIATASDVLAYEQREGTAAMLRQFAQVPQPGAVLVKLVKPQQDMRLDLPTIGPDTVKQAQAAGITGIVISAGKTLIVDQPQTIATANQAGIFLLGLEA